MESFKQQKSRIFERFVIVFLAIELFTMAMGFGVFKFADFSLYIFLTIPNVIWFVIVIIREGLSKK